MATLTIEFTPPSPVPDSGYIVKYRVKGTTGAYTTVEPNPTTSPVVITGLAAHTNYEGTIQSDCSYGGSFIINWATNSCFCPDETWTAVIDEYRQYCQKIETATPDCTDAGTNLACHFGSTSYGVYGVVFYKNTTPITGLTTFDGRWVIGTSNPNVYNFAINSAPNNVNFSTAVGSSIFYNPTALNNVGRLNTTGIWKCGNQNYFDKPLGFTRQITLSNTKTYLIGCGADNYATIKINGTILVQQDQYTTAASNYFNSLFTQDQLFRYWHVYPVVLNAGDNIIEMSGTNAASSPGEIGFEIYDATEAQLMACVTESDLDSYILYSTQGISITSLTPGSAYTNGTYNSVPLTGGTGTGATANIVIDGGVVVSAWIKNEGTGYVTGDVLSCLNTNVGGTGSGFHFTIKVLPGDVNDYSPFDVGNCNCDAYPGYTLVDTGTVDGGGNEIYQCQLLTTTACE